MKKIIKMSEWNLDNFTSENVDNESHWMVKGLKRALTLLDIGNFSISYNSNLRVTIVTDSYGSFDIEHPVNTSNTSAYVFYVNSDEKELFGCASDTNVASYNKEVSNLDTTAGNVIRGIRRPSQSNTVIKTIGGYLALKFKDGQVIGTATDEIVDYYNSAYPIPSWNSMGVVLGDRFESLASPLTAVPIKYTRAPIYRKLDVYFYYVEGESARFLGEYFTGINVCDKYYVGALKSSDNKKFVYNGYLFLVDDATDIETVTV